MAPRGPRPASPFSGPKNGISQIFHFRNAEKGAFAKGALHQFVAKIVKNYWYFVSYIRARGRKIVANLS